MEYQVPQFIEVEDKIFGPLTLKQFIYLAGGAGIITGLVLYLPLVIGIVLSIPIGALAGGLAFYKINGKPLIDIIEAGVNYYLSRRLYLWRKEQKPAPEAQAPSTKIEMGPEAPTQKLGLSANRIQELAFSLDSNVQQNSRS